MVGKSEGKRLLGRPRHRREDIVKVYPQGVEWQGIDWICVAQDENQYEALLKLGFHKMYGIS